jgi:serine/threonine protein kinase
MVIERPLDDLFNKALDPLDYGYMQDYDVSYLSHGTFRDAWRFHRPNTQDDFVLKRFMLHKKYNQGDIHTIHKEAIIMERLMPSPRIMDIYGYCGTSVLVEAMASEVAYSRIIPSDGLASQAELDNLDDAYPRNNLTIGEKLQLSLSMAESLVDLHEFREGGLIVHSDTHIEQWLVAPDKTLKLNDFNNAHVMRWDDKRQEYCTRHSMYGGTWRAPEEYDGSSQDETKDTFSFANGIYAMITGLWPFYDDAFNGINEDTIEEAIIAGKRPFVDERYKQRSFIEKMLVEVMEACWAQDRKDRPTMTRVVEILKKVKATAWKKGELKPSSWIDIPMPE